MLTVNFLVACFIAPVASHEKWDDPKKPPHEDFDPVIEFPDNNPNYRPAEWNRDQSSDEEKDHNQIHKLVTTMSHTQMQLQRNIADLQQAIKDQKIRGKQQEHKG